MAHTQGTAGKQATVTRREPGTYKREDGDVPFPFPDKLHVLGSRIFIFG